MQPINLSALRPRRAWGPPLRAVLVRLGDGLLYMASSIAGSMYLAFRWPLIAASVFLETVGVEFVAAHGGTSFSNIAPIVIAGLVPAGLVLALRTLWRAYAWVQARRTWGV